MTDSTSTEGFRLHGRVFAMLVPAMILLDQITKILIRVKLPFDDRGRAARHKIIDGFFNIVHAENPGAAWGILGDSQYRMLFFTVVTLVAFVLIIGYFRQLRAHDRVLSYALAFVFAGATGNFIDRLLYRSVTDFLQFYASGDVGVWIKSTFGSRYWPAFNVADICINVGVGLFIFHVLFLEKKLEARYAAEAEAAGAAE